MSGIENGMLVAGAFGLLLLASGVFDRLYMASILYPPSVM
jgi:hypothetical protein